MNEDPSLKSLLSDVSTVRDEVGFDKWRTSFLECYTQYLDKSGSAKAESAFKDFTTGLGALKKVNTKLEGLIEKGDLSVDRVSVKGKMAMSELKAKVGNTVQHLQQLLPTTEKEIQSLGFSKWHMGAVLVRDGFTEYAIMMQSQAVLRSLILMVRSIWRACSLPKVT